MFDVNTKLKEPKTKFKPAMLVSCIQDGSVGFVTQVTKRWVHVLWLINTRPGYVEYNDSTPMSEEDAERMFDTLDRHHFISHCRRDELEVMPVGTEVTIKQVTR